MKQHTIEEMADQFGRRSTVKVVLAEDAEKAIAEAMNKQGWRDVEDEPPGRMEKVIVCGTVKHINILRQCYEARHYTKGEFLTPCDDRVLGVRWWIPLSEQPTEPKVCRWHRREKNTAGANRWQSECGLGCASASEGIEAPDMHYCPKCGKPLEIVD